METSYVDEPVDNLLNLTPAYIGPERQLVAHVTPVTPRAPLPSQMTRDDIKRALPPGFSFLGTRDDEKLGLLWEAQHRAGVAFGISAPDLILTAQTVHAVMEDGGTGDCIPGFNRRRKRRTRRDKDLMRCKHPLCSALVWPDQMSEHLANHLGPELVAPLSEVFTRPARVKDDGTGDDLTLDDPARARAVEAED
jgi:hypothetical protein